ncbi:MAG TPA: zf-HC2 domain-containing protein [Casimicrobiaceae bacterium]|nr:zf-HC2 domain-containing protein [Casimicrobiaceae bacterium]
MKCDDAQTLIAAYVDGELDRLRGHLVERHVRGCAQCAEQHRQLLALRERLRSEVPYFAAPPGLADRIRSAMTSSGAALQDRPHSARERWRWLCAGALAGCAATVLAWMVATSVADWRAGRDLAVEAVATHVRATLNNRLVEVASSDEHTVKPWLSARLDYSPPVQDFVGDGFPLVGGRVDMLGQQAVATLVYRYRNHSIDVFVRPEPVRGLASPRALRGFNVAHAAWDGWDWLVVSDASADVLAGFVERLAHAQPTGEPRPK